MSDMTEMTLPIGIMELAAAAESARLRYETLGGQPRAEGVAERAMQRAHYEMAREEHWQAQDRLSDACAAAVRAKREGGQPLVTP